MAPCCCYVVCVGEESGAWYKGWSRKSEGGQERVVMAVVCGCEYSTKGTKRGDRERERVRGKAKRVRGRWGDGIRRYSKGLVEYVGE